MSGSTSGVPAYSHIVVVMEENHAYNEIIGSPSAPYINGTLVPGGAVMSNYFAITHPSEPNYFALYAGSTFGVTDDNFHAEPDPTLDTVLNAAGKSFAGYVEQPIDQNHTPWEYFPEGTSVEKDISSFTAGNFAALPTVSFVIPNVNDDMHDGTIQQGDTWLQNNINAYAQWAKSNNSLLVVTWDEDDGAQNNQVPAILYGADITPGLYNTPYNHYNLLSAIATAESVTGPNNAATASPITGIYNTPTCFVSGTRILTERGEVAVEDLREGDRVVTVENEGQTVRQVRWIGHRQIDLAIHPDPEMMSPIRIRCDAIGENIPHRDLLVSADHAIFIDGKLIPARMLVNGTTIVKETCARKVHYFHIELDQHSVLFAEGLTAESYLDTGTVHSSPMVD